MSQEAGFSLDEEQSRLERLEEIQKQSDPYSNKVNRTHTCKQVLDDFDELTEAKAEVSVVGRLFTLRKHGGSIFADLRDGFGTVQLFFKKDIVGKEEFSFIKDLVDRGDFVQITGTTFLTKRDAKTILVSDFVFLTKSLLPLPEKFHGLADIELRYRHRYLDLLSNEKSVQNLRTRGKVIQSIRSFLDTNDFMEVETPILQSIAGGATARPFVTHHNSLDIDMYLRVAPELYLKRLVVGGFERVYEVARCFRNEGVDQNHNPEFTQVEFYFAYEEYEGLMKFTEDMITTVLKDSVSTLDVEYKEHKLNFKAPFERITFRDAIKEYAGFDMNDFEDVASLGAKAKELGVDVVKGDGRGKILDNIMKKYVRPKLIQPTFLTDHPIELSPLSRKRDDDPRFVERFQLLVAGEIELLNAYSELNDPLDQETRFKEQEKLRSGGDDEAQPYDEEFVKALKHGMPPTAGFGMGIDRFVALITDSENLKEVIAFPTLKDKKE